WAGSRAAGLTISAARCGPTSAGSSTTTARSACTSRGRPGTPTINSTPLAAWHSHARRWGKIHEVANTRFHQGPLRRPGGGLRGPAGGVLLGRAPRLGRGAAADGHAHAPDRGGPGLQGRGDGLRLLPRRVVPGR